MRGRLKVEGALGGLSQQQPSLGCLRAHNCYPRPPLDTGHLSCQGPAGQELLVAGVRWGSSQAPLLDPCRGCL